MKQIACPLPTAESETGLRVLKALARQRSLLQALEIMHADVGNIFQLTLPSFHPVFLAGPEYNRRVLVTDRERFLWRSDKDPVTRLLRHGLLVEDGESHDYLRSLMDPLLHRRQVHTQIDEMWRYTENVLDRWSDDMTLDMLVEMRRVALLILMGTLFSVDFWPNMDRMWKPILRSIQYISPGPWLIWPDVPRPGYKRDLGQLDAYLKSIIPRRRTSEDGAEDLLSHLIDSGMNDELIRDQMLTMLIAGHDTSTALLAWALCLLGSHPESMALAQAEADRILTGNPPDVQQLNQLRYLDKVIKETIRLYPPIHVGNRMTNSSVKVNGYELPEDTRVMYSIYLSHRDSNHWSQPNKYDPERFERSERHEVPPFAYVPFGGGPRNCIGAAFAQVEAEVVLAQILQRFDLQLVSKQVRSHMGATLEPRPGVMMRVSRRRKGDA